MNNDLIERIDVELDRRDLEAEAMLNTGLEPSIDYLSMEKLLRDCKAALTQQQEEEPVAWRFKYIGPNIHRRGRVEFTEDPEHAKWLSGLDFEVTPLHPPKPAAQPQVPESRNIRAVEMHGDQSVLVSFPSCRSASAFAGWLSAAKEEGK